MEKNFSDLIVVKDGHLALADSDGKIAVEGSTPYRASLDAVQDLIRQTAAAGRDAHEAMGAAVREPIRQLARYKEWTHVFFTPWSLAPTDDNRIPLDNPIGAAFISSPEGRPMMVTPGVQLWTRPSFYEIKAGLRIHWNLLKTAGWPILARRLEEVADDLARRRDAKRKAFLDAGVAAVTGHAVSVSGGKFTKASLDSFIVAAAQIGFPITQGAINPARLMDMTGWTNGSTSALPYFWAPQETSNQVYRNLWAEGYANIRWFASISVPMDQIYLSGDPAEIGYDQDHGAGTSASDVDIEEGVDLHMIREEHAHYIGNNYNVWKITITA